MASTNLKIKDLRWKTSKSINRPRKLPDLDAKITLKSDAYDIVKELSRCLGEPNKTFLRRIVGILERKKVFELFFKTQFKELHGGLLTKTKKRRKTPGGVFIYLLKEDKEISGRQKRLIFATKYKLADKNDTTQSSRMDM